MTGQQELNEGSHIINIYFAIAVNVADNPTGNNGLVVISDINTCDVSKVLPYICLTIRIDRVLRDI